MTRVSTLCHLDESLPATGVRVAFSDRHELPNGELNTVGVCFSDISTFYHTGAQIRQHIGVLLEAQDAMDKLEAVKAEPVAAEVK